MRKLLFLLVLLVAACGGGGPTDAASSQDASVVDTAQTDLQEIVVDGQGMTLYVFDQDTGGRSSCNDACADQWPPFLTDGEPQAEGGADPGLLGTSERDDGTTQVTYDGRPLYHFAQDSQPGDTNGQGVGNVWWVVAPDGTAVTGSSGQVDDPGRSSGGYDY